MNIFFEILKNLAHKKYLKKKKKNLAEYVELFGGFLGLLFVFVANKPLSLILDNVPVIFEVLTFSVVLPVAFALGALSVLSIFSFYMYKTGRFTKIEAKYYAIKLSYPENWYQPNLRHMSNRYE